MTARATRVMVTRWRFVAHVLVLVSLRVTGDAAWAESPAEANERIASLEEQLENLGAEPKGLRIRLQGALVKQLTLVGRHDEARTLGLRTLDAASDLPAGSIEAMIAVDSLSEAYVRGPPSPEAEFFLRRGFSQRPANDRDVPPSRDWWLGQLVEYYRAHDRHSEALEIIRARIEQEGGNACASSESCIAVSRYSVREAELLSELNRLELSIAAYDVALAVLDAGRPFEVIVSLQVRSRRAVGLHRAGRVEEANADHQSAIAGWERLVADPTHRVAPTSLLEPLTDFAHFLDSTGQEEEADQVRKRIRDLRQSAEQ